MDRLRLAGSPSNSRKQWDEWDELAVLAGDKVGQDTDETRRTTGIQIQAGVLLVYIYFIRARLVSFALLVSTIVPWSFQTMDVDCRVVG